ncbi:MAG TPA: ShlB/FhaC/HecB family hemolysin secretion/activation protein [Stellaceae bacterium]
MSATAMAWAIAGAAAHAQTPGIGPPPSLPEHRGAPIVPQLQPGAPPPPSLAVPPPPAAATAPAANAGPRFVLRDVKIEGNTVLDPAVIREVVAPYLGKPVGSGDLEEIRRKFTRLFIDRGYVNSGAVLPDQNVANGVVTYRFVEGRASEIDITGTDHFKPEYFRSRLAHAAAPPLDIANIEEELQILLQDPLLRRLNIRLEPGLVPGEAKLSADVLEAPRYSLSAQIADDQSPTVGAIRGQLLGSFANILGVGDILTAEYGRSQALNDGFVGYSVPLAPDDTRLNLRYDKNGTVVVTPGLGPLDITSSYSSVAVGLSRPFYRTAEQNLTLGISLERRRERTFLLGMPFDFTLGSQNGMTNVTALRLSQSWLDRNAERALALRSTFSFGLQALGATVTDVAPTGQFFAWLGQAQYVSRLYKDWEGLVRGDLQLADRPLFQIEQFALGGIDTVRGYREYLTVTDDAALASAELHIPLGRLRVPYLAKTDDAGTLQLVPFFDYGRGWNVDRPTPFPPSIAGVGAGLRWLVGSGMVAEFYYGKALRHVDVGNSLEDRGIYFRLTTSFF